MAVRQLRNSGIQVLNGFANAFLNFIVVFVYARYLGPEKFGQFVGSQALVLVWIIAVDLGITTGLISALHRTRADDARSLLRNAFLLRFAGAALGTSFVALVSWFSHGGDAESLTRDLAFSPHLFAYGAQYTMTSYLVFRGQLGLSVVANLTGLLAANALTFALVLQGASVSTLLLSQSWGGFLAAAIMALGLRSNSASAPASPSDAARPNLREIWIHAWPNLVILIATTVWARLDQITAVRMLGFSDGGQYGLAARLAAVPALMASSVNFALFSDFQRVARDAPEKVTAFAGGITKLLVRYGLFLNGAVLLLLGLGLAPFLPQFRSAIHLLPGFLPGVWGYSVYALLIGSLLGTGNYREVAQVHIGALALYLLALPLLTLGFGLSGTVAGYDLFAVLLAVLTYRALKRTGVLPATHRVLKGLSPEERAFFSQIRSKLTPKWSNHPA